MESRWVRRAGPGIAAMGAVALIVSTTAGAPPAAWDPPACRGPAAPGSAPSGAWFRLDPSIADGVRIGQRLTVGSSAMAVPRHLDLDPESFASSPVGGTVLVGTDDGRSSSVSLLDLAAGCRWTIASSSEVIRRAVVSPEARSLLEFRVDRRSRADRGVWQRPLDGGDPVRRLDPLDPDARFGPTWLTELAWGEDGTTLVVGSCGEVACRYRLMPMASGAIRTLAVPGLGALVGLVDGHLIAHAACRGLPCPLVSIDVTTGAAVTLHDSAGFAVVAHDDAGRAVIVHEIGAEAGAIRSVAPDGRDPRTLGAPPDGTRLVAGAISAGSGAEHPPDQILFAPDGRLPLAGSRPAFTRRVSDGHTAPLDEVLR